MNFGEIVEPSTRALIEDDYEDYPETTEYTSDWNGNKDVPNDLDVLIFIETDKLLKIFNKCTQDNLIHVCKLRNGGLHIYRYSTPQKSNIFTYVACYEEKAQLSYGQIVSEISDWIQKSKEIITITSASLATYQNAQSEAEVKTLIKMLSNRKETKYRHGKLEPPNLITGLGACVMSYCIQSGKECTSFISYMDSSPVDSVNTNPLFNLFSQIHICPKVCKISDQLPSNNLYM